MRKITINPNNSIASLLEIQRASYENDTTDIGQAFGFRSNGALTGPPVNTLTLEITAPTLANTNAVLSTLIAILQRGGVSRTT